MRFAAGFDRAAIGVCAKAEAQCVIAQCPGFKQRAEDGMRGSAIMHTRPGAIDDPCHPQLPRGGSAATTKRDINSIDVGIGGQELAGGHVEDLVVAKMLEPLSHIGRHAMAMNFPKRPNVPEEARAFGKVEPLP